MAQIKREELIKKIKIGLIVFVVITLIVFVSAFIFTYEEETKDFFKYFKKIYFIYTFFVWLLFISFDALTIFSISFGIKKLKVIDCFSFITMGQFLTAVTPFGFLGLPFQLYYLTRKNYEISEGLSVFAIKSAIYTIIYILVIPVVFIYASYIFENMFFKHAFKIISIIIISGICLLIFFLVKPEKITKIIKWRKFSEQILKFRETFLGYFRKNPVLFLISFLFSTLSYLFYLFIPVFLIHGLHSEVPTIKIMIYQIVLRFSILFSPAPGGSGVAEAGFLALFFKTIPRHFLGIYTLLWRFFTAYLGPIIGGIILINFLRKKQ